jgi:long-chain acyl-CoA synthetase
MARRTNANFDVVPGGAGAIRRTARAHNDGFDVVWMDRGLHFMKTHNSIREGASRNRESNPILSRWEEVFSSRKREAAVVAPDRTVLRTFSSIEEEAQRWEERLDRFNSPGAVCLQIGNRAEWPAIVIATWRSNRTLVPLELEVPDGRRRQIEGSCGAGVRIVLADARLEMVQLEDLKSLVPSGADMLKVTSGTTSEPRAICFSASQLLADYENIRRTMGLRQGDLNYGVASFAHSYGFSNLITPLLCDGLGLVVSSDLIPRAITEGLQSTAATVFPGVPALFRSLAEFSVALSELRLCISAGAPLPSAVGRNFFERWNRKIHSFYGASECGGICYDRTGRIDAPPNYVGEALEGVSLSIETEGPSEVWVRSLAVGAGYWPPGEEVNFAHGAFRPADLLERSGAGFVLVGRTSEMINVAGRKLNPDEVERVLKMCPKVREAVVLGLPGNARGEEVAACIQGEVPEAELRRLCASNLAAWQVPRRWFFFEHIPRNARGKISRADLRARLVGDT